MKTGVNKILRSDILVNEETRGSGYFGNFEAERSASGDYSQIYGLESS